jgi:hypothetical protein
MGKNNAGFNPWVLCLYALLAVELMAVAVLPKPSRAEIRSSLFGAPEVEPTGPWYFKCAEADCGHELTVWEFRDYQAMLGSLPKSELDDSGDLSMEALRLPCPKCERQTLYQAEFCTHCRKIFVPADVLDPYDDASNDKCPDCGFSPTEERLRQWRLRRAQTDADDRPVVKARE